MKQPDNFCNNNTTIEAWYTVTKSSNIKPGSVKIFAVGPTWLVVRRFKNKTVVASERYCPHMGADLALSKEAEGEKIQCNFHRLQYDCHGNCASNVQNKDAYKLKTFPVKEQYGLIWVYLGDTPSYEIPDLNLKNGYTLHLPSKTINAHHHIVIPNPLDKVHVGPIHSLEVHEYKLERNGVHITETVSGTYTAWWMKLLTRMGNKHMPIVFSAHGPTMSVADALWHKTRVVIIFTARQDENNKCSTNTVIWLNSYNPIDWLRALIVILVILKQDVDILNTINVKTNFTPEDEGMIAFKEVVDSMPIYR